MAEPDKTKKEETKKEEPKTEETKKPTEEDFSKRFDQVMERLDAVAKVLTVISEKEAKAPESKKPEEKNEPEKKDPENKKEPEKKPSEDELQAISDQLDL